MLSPIFCLSLMPLPKKWMSHFVLRHNSHLGLSFACKKVLSVVFIDHNCLAYHDWFCHDANMVGMLIFVIMLSLIFCLLLTLLPNKIMSHFSPRNNGNSHMKGAVFCFCWLQLLDILQLMLPWCQHGSNVELFYHHTQSNFLLLHALLHFSGVNYGFRKRGDCIGSLLHDWQCW